MTGYGGLRGDPADAGPVGGLPGAAATLTTSCPPTATTARPRARSPAGPGGRTDGSDGARRDLPLDGRVGRSRGRRSGPHRRAGRRPPPRCWPRCPAARRPVARLVLGMARRYIPLREVGKTAFLQALDSARAAARVIGADLARQGVLGDPDDVFYLTVDELADPTSAGLTLKEAGRCAGNGATSTCSSNSPRPGPASRKRSRSPSARRRRRGQRHHRPGREPRRGRGPGPGRARPPAVKRWSRARSSSAKPPTPAGRRCSSSPAAW